MNNKSKIILSITFIIGCFIIFNNNAKTNKPQVSDIKIKSNDRRQREVVKNTIKSRNGSKSELVREKNTENHQDHSNCDHPEHVHTALEDQLDTQQGDSYQVEQINQMIRQQLKRQKEQEIADAKIFEKIKNRDLQEIQDLEEMNLSMSDLSGAQE